MKNANVWELVSKEVESIIKAIEKGEIKTRKEYNEYLKTFYNWKISDAIEYIVTVYIGINNIEIPWDNETTETDE